MESILNELFSMLISLSLSHFLSDKKLSYRLIVKILNRNTLNGKIDTPQGARSSLIDGVGSEWRALYKPPLLKKVADL